MGGTTEKLNCKQTHFNEMPKKKEKLERTGTKMNPSVSSLDKPYKGIGNSSWISLVHVCKNYNQQVDSRVLLCKFLDEALLLLPSVILMIKYD